MNKNKNKKTDLRNKTFKRKKSNKRLNLYGGNPPSETDIYILLRKNSSQINSNSHPYNDKITFTFLIDEKFDYGNTDDDEI